MESGIVGYQGIVVTNGYSIFAPTFKAINASEKMDLNSIKVTKLDGTEIPTDYAHAAEWCGGAVYVNIIGDDGNYAAAYRYYRNISMQGWYNGSTKIGDGEVWIPKGQGFMVNNAYKPGGVATNLIFQTSGEVVLTPVSEIAPGYSMYGNCTPVEVDLADINILKLDGTEIPTDYAHAAEWCGGAVYLNILGQDGNYAKIYRFYRNITMQGWYDGSTKIIKGDCKLPAGTAFLINNAYKVSNVAQTVKISIPGPLN